MIHLIQIITVGSTQNLGTAHHSEYVWPQNDIWGSGFGSFYFDVHPHSLGGITGDITCFGLPLKCADAVLKLIKIGLLVSMSNTMLDSSTYLQLRASLISNRKQIGLSLVIWYTRGVRPGESRWLRGSR